MELYEDPELLPPLPADDEDEFFTPEEILPSDVPAAYTSGRALGSGKSLGQRRAPANDIAQELLQEATTLARLKGRKPTMMDGIVAGLSAQTGRASQNPGAAMLDGFTTGFAGAYKGRNKPDDTKDRFDMISKLFGMHNQAERTKAYAERASRVGRGGSRGGGRGRAPMDPLRREALITGLVNKSPYQKALDADEGALKKMDPEKRADLERRRDEYRAKLEAMGLQPQQNESTSETPPASPSTRSLPTPGPAPAVVPSKQPTKPNTTPRSQLPQGMSKDRARAALKTAMEQAKDDPVKLQALRDKALAWGL